MTIFHPTIDSGCPGGDPWAPDPNVYLNSYFSHTFTNFPNIRNAFRGAAHVFISSTRTPWRDPAATSTAIASHSNAVANSIVAGREQVASGTKQKSDDLAGRRVRNE